VVACGAEVLDHAPARATESARPMSRIGFHVNSHLNPPFGRRVSVWRSSMPAIDHREPHPPISRRRRQESLSPGRSSRYQPTRRQSWAGKSPKDILASYSPGKAAPEHVLEVLIELFNTLHTSLEKTVSHKTRHERAHFLRRFFRDLRLKAGFKTMPDPRNLGQKHIRAMVQVWKQDHWRRPPSRPT
jgi:hypothetical protein